MHIIFIGDTMKIIAFFKKLSFSFVYIFAINLFLVNIGYNIPINIFTIFIVYIFKLPGIILLLFLSRW